MIIQYAKIQSTVGHKYKVQCSEIQLYEETLSDIGAILSLVQ